MSTRVFSAQLSVKLQLGIDIFPLFSLLVEVFRVFPVLSNVNQHEFIILSQMLQASLSEY